MSNTTTILKDNGTFQKELDFAVHKLKENRENVVAFVVAAVYKDGESGAAMAGNPKIVERMLVRSLVEVVTSTDQLDALGDVDTSVAH